MTHSELIKATAEKTGYSRKYVRETLTAFIDILREDIIEDKDKTVVFGLGTFDVNIRKDVTCRNPKTGETFVKDIKKVKFSPCADMRNRVKEA